VTVRKYRSGSTGTAYTEADDWGIEAPHPRGPVSFAVFAHEVGHQLKHRDGSRPRWLEEIEAWEFALSCFERFELPGVERARASAARHLRYTAARLARRRRLSPETAQRVLDRMPAWVWKLDDPREAVVGFDVYARGDLERIAAT
jgi:hypothetical protein